METNNKEHIEKSKKSDSERYAIKSAIEKVKSGEMNNIIINSHISNLTKEQKLCIASFWAVNKVQKKHSQLQNNNCQ